MIRVSADSGSFPKKPRYGPTTAGGRFKRFAHNAKIPSLTGLNISLAGPNDNYNDCLVIPHYEPNVHTFSGEQRRGVARNIDSAGSHNEHVQIAMEMISPLSIDTPIPSDLGRLSIWSILTMIPP